MTQQVKNLPAIQELQVRFLGWKDPLEGGIATHSSTLAWRISWSEEHGGHSPQRRKELDPTAYTAQAVSTSTC